MSPSVLAKHLGFALALCCVSPVPALADFYAGLRAADRGEYAAAADKWTPLAEHGHTAAQVNLAKLYYEGLGVTRDPAEAAKWLDCAAGHDNVIAQAALGTMYAFGDGIEEDKVQGYVWLALAASNGDEIAESTRQRLSPLMNAVDIEKAKVLADDWHPRTCRYEHTGDVLGTQAFEAIVEGLERRRQGR